MTNNPNDGSPTPPPFPQAPEYQQTPQGQSYPQAPQYQQAPQGQPYPQTPYGGQMQVPYSTLAIVGFIISFLGYLSIVGIILSIIAQRQIRQTGQRGAALAKWGIIVGIIVLVLTIIGTIVNAIYLSSTLNDLNNLNN